MNFAIIGSGIAGLTAAYLLYPEHEFTVFEAGDHVGGHTNTIHFEWGGLPYAIDTGFIVYNERNYPLFTRLLAELGVETQLTDMSFSVRCERSGLEYRGADWNGLFAQRRNLLRPRFWGMLRDMLRFNCQIGERLRESGEDLTVGEFFKKYPFGDSFIQQFFLPMASAIWSCPSAKIEEFPMRFIADFYRQHGLLGFRDRPAWRVISGGSDQYVRQLIAPWRDRIRLRTPITQVRRTRGGLLVKPRYGEPQRFDHVIMACHSDQALRILGGHASRVEREVLGEFPYERNEVLLHTDASVLPNKRRAWASWNYWIPPKPAEKASVTYYMNRLQRLRSPIDFCVTLNDTGRVRPECVIRAMTYHHPIFNRKRAWAQARHGELINHGGISYCGAYWGNGFHEDGVRSAWTMIDRLREELCKAASTPAGCDTVAGNRLGMSFETVCT